MLERKWWHGKAAYQIYPKSFCDSNGDGIGDVRGIISKLDYLKDLGIDIVWLSPIYCSPLADQGYDISDYRGIDPRFGTMEEVEELIAEAKKRDMHILMDLVVNHCSDEHEWFKKACEDPDGKYGKYFYIVDAEEGKLPNNWRSYFGGSAWEHLPNSGGNKYYLHVFHKKQPDLNWENPELRQEVYDMINWWLDKGIAGFRIDAIINIKKPEDIYTSYPADRDDGLSVIFNMINDAIGVDDFLREMKEKTFAKYDAFTIGEVFSDRPDVINTFIGSRSGHFSSMFDFSTALLGKSNDGYYKSQPYICADDYKKAVFDVQERIADIAFITNIIENHDEPRGVSHYLPLGAPEEAKKMLGMVNVMLKGLPFIYQGQELGMTNVPIERFEDIDDCGTIDEYYTALHNGLTPEEALKAIAPFTRDNARTPFHWSAEEHAGFTTGTPWLKVNPNYKEINAEDQMNRKDSVRSWYKDLIALRKNPEYQETVVYGDLIPYLRDQHDLIAYYRRSEEKTLLVLANYSFESQGVPMEMEIKKILMDNYNDLVRVDSDGKLCLVMKPFQGLILEMC